MIGLRGFGSTDMGPLGQAQFTGQINPSFLPTQYFQPSYLPAGQLSAIPTDDYATSGFASQIASLLGGSVVQAPPPGDLNGTGIPPANWIRLSDGGMVLPGNLFPPGVILSFPDECTAEHELLGSVPGGVLSATCAGGGTGLTPSQMATTQAPTPTPTMPPPAAITTPVIPVRIPVAQTVQAPQQGIVVAPPLPSSDQSVQIGVTPNPVPATNPPGTPTSASPSTCFNPISEWLSMDTCLGPLGIVEWAVVAAIALYAFSAKGGR